MRFRKQKLSILPLHGNQGRPCNSSSVSGTAITLAPRYPAAREDEKLDIFGPFDGSSQHWSRPIIRLDQLGVVRPDGIAVSQYIAGERLLAPEIASVIAFNPEPRTDLRRMICRGARKSPFA